MPIRHVILDRDGVLNREAPDGGWVSRPEHWQWEPGALDGLRLLSQAGLRLSVATNQSGVGRGVFAAASVDAVHERMLAEVAAAGASIDAVFVCPHAPADGCRCRKPAPGLIEAAVTAAGIPAAETIAVGDAPRDLEAARAAGARSVLVRTGKGRATEARLDDDSVVVYDDLLSAARAIVAAAGGRSSTMSIHTTFEEHAAVMAEAAATLADVIERVVDRAVTCLEAGRKILVCGNGGSAADAQHLAAELVCRFAFDRKALPALALTTDTSALTAIANDLGYERVFARQVEALARPGDLLVAISTSGSSANVVAAARQARAAGCFVVAMTGRGGGALAEHADILVAAPSGTVARIQEVHALVIHMLAEAVEAALCARGES